MGAIYAVYTAPLEDMRFVLTSCSTDDLPSCPAMRSIAAS